MELFKGSLLAYRLTAFPSRRVRLLSLLLLLNGFREVTKHILDGSDERLDVEAAAVDTSVDATNHLVEKARLHQTGNHCHWVWVT